MLLNQAIALVKGQKSRAENGLTAAYHQIQRSDPFIGISRTYRSKTEDGDKFPDESVHVQVSVDKVIENATKELVRFFDLTATLDRGNTESTADVVVDGNVLLKDVPVTYLLFLDKKLVDLGVFVSRLPMLDPAQTWNFDNNVNVYRSDPTETTKTKRVFRNHVKAEATEKHPAQVETYTEDEVIGYWTTTKFSGMLPAARVQLLLDRVRKLQDAVKVAQQKANSKEIQDVSYGDAFFGYLFG